MDDNDENSYQYKRFYYTAAYTPKNLRESKNGICLIFA